MLWDVANLICIGQRWCRGKGEERGTNNSADVCFRGDVHYRCWRSEGCVAPAGSVLFECCIRGEVDGCFLRKLGEKEACEFCLHIFGGWGRWRNLRFRDVNIFELRSSNCKLVCSCWKCLHYGQVIAEDEVLSLRLISCGMRIILGRVR